MSQTGTGVPTGNKLVFAEIQSPHIQGRHCQPRFGPAEAQRLVKKQPKLSRVKGQDKAGVRDAGKPGPGVGFPLPEEAKVIATADAVQQPLGHGGVEKVHPSFFCRSQPPRSSSTAGGTVLELLNPLERRQGLPNGRVSKYPAASQSLEERKATTGTRLG